MARLIKKKGFLLTLGLTLFVAFLIFMKPRSLKETGTNTSGPTRTLHLYAMSDYFPETVIKTFEARCNCRVSYDVFSSNEELVAKLQAGATGYDVIVPSDYMVRALISGGLVQPLNKTLLPHFKNLADSFQDAPYDPQSRHSVPYTWGTTGLIYNSKKVKPKTLSWELVFEKEYAGRISLLDDVREVMGAMLRIQGHSANATDEAEVEKAQKTLKALKAGVRLFSSDPKQHLLSGDIWIAQIYSGDASQLTQQNPDLKYFVPREGGIIWIDTLAIPKSAPNPDLAHAFIDLILETEMAKTITDELLYASPNATLETLLKEEGLKASSLRKMKKGQLEFLEDLGSFNEKLDRLWTEAKAL